MLFSMSYVAINVLSVPEGAGATLEERFAARKGAVEGSAGFERFELLRPVEGTTDYLVYTRWASEADFVAWRDGGRMAAGHAGQAGPPAASGSTLWAFEVVQYA
jgi:heme-degrading monooxygenase HmoA